MATKQRSNQPAPALSTTVNWALVTALVIPSVAPSVQAAVAPLLKNSTPSWEPPSLALQPFSDHHPAHPHDPHPPETEYATSLPRAPDRGAFVATGMMGPVVAPLARPPSVPTGIGAFGVIGPLSSTEGPRRMPTGAPSQLLDPFVARPLPPAAPGVVGPAAPSGVAGAWSATPAGRAAWDAQFV
jgi:hypothetical protein